MDTYVTEASAVTQSDDQFVQLAELDLVLVGGGIGDVVFG